MLKDVIDIKPMAK